ncbi:MAG: ATP-dependent zinc metalloprotease FtsH [Chthonomonadales bacterium]|nr:ATP-dependent zinc metalloprotease FtsH [Chthonomonadales bacterium]
MVLLVVFALQRNNIAHLGESDRPLGYTEFVAQIEANNVRRGEFEKDVFRGEYNHTPPTARSETFVVNLPAAPDSLASLQQLLLDHKVPFRYKQPLLSDFMTGILVSIILPLAFIAFLWFIFIRQAQSGGNQALSFGRARAKRLGENVPKLTFDDVAGVQEAKQELQEIVEFLKNAKKFQALGAKIPKGVLLLGPPGCGKTMLSRAIAGEAGVPFFHISGSDFVEMFVGVGASRVRDLFDTAKSNRPSLIFIDEIDAVGRQRGAGVGGGHDEREQTLNQLLVEMDGFDPNSGVILIAATNRPDVLDPALLRPGRFDRRVVVDAPDARGRKEIFRVHLRGKPLDFDGSEAEREKAIEGLAQRTPGFTGADIANLVNEAALLAARRDKTRITLAEFEESIDRVIMGPERKSRVLTEDVRRRTAFHEAGHAIVGELLPKADPVNKVSILPRGMALGYTISLPTEDRYNRTKAEIEDTISMALAGRVAEMIVFGDMDTGAASDLDKATDMARAMVCEYGMSERLGPLRLGRRHGNPFLGRDIMEDRDYSEEVAQAIDEEVRSIMDRNYQRARQILTQHFERMEAIVERLMQKESMEREEFLAVLYAQPLPEEAPEDPLRPSTPGAAPAIEPEHSRPRLEPRLRPEPGPA